MREDTYQDLVSGDVIEAMGRVLRNVPRESLPARASRPWDYLSTGGARVHLSALERRAVEYVYDQMAAGLGTVDIGRRAR